LPLYKHPAYFCAHDLRGDAKMDDSLLLQMMERFGLHPVSLEQLITEDEYARLKRCSRDTIRRQQERGDGAPKIRISPRRIGYRLRDVLADIKRCEVAPNILSAG
jgi:hypothetical protein